MLVNEQKRGAMNAVSNGAATAIQVGMRPYCPY